MLSSLVEVMIDLWYPRRCVLCEDEAGQHWFAGPRLPGLRRWDRPQLCPRCLAGLVSGGVRRELNLSRGGALPLAGGAWTRAGLLTVLGLYKFHGLRGLAWPLGSLVASGLLGARRSGLICDGLVAVPLHRGRRRQRGFNQAALLAHLAGHFTALPVHDAVLRRRRATPQQARLAATGSARHANVEGAFEAEPPPPGSSGRVAVIDDLITSGATVTATAAALHEAGWRVVLAVAAGLGLPAGTGEVGADSRSCCSTSRETEP